MKNNNEFTLLNASVDGPGNIVTLYFEETLDTSSIPSRESFSVFNGDAEVTITSLQVVNNQVILGLSAVLDTVSSVSVSFVAEGESLQSVDGGRASSFDSFEVGNYLSLSGSASESFSAVSSIPMEYGAEISAYDPASGRFFVTSPENGLQVLSLDEDLQMTALGSISLGSNELNSVAVKNGMVAVAVAAENKTGAGTVWFLDADGVIGDASMILGSVTVGANPDMLTFTPDGAKVLVANEGEMAEDGTNPEGSVSIIDLSAGVGYATVSTAVFGDFNTRIEELKEAGVRLFAGEAGFEETTVAEDLEPEYISISPDGTTAFVTLQENNAIAILDIASGTFTDIVPLGLKSFLGLSFDGSDKDGGCNPRTDLPVYGQYMPDAIASFTGSDGQTWYVIADEGDDRDDFVRPDETAKVSAVDLDDTLFPDEAELKSSTEIGPLKISSVSGNNGDTDGDGDIDQLLSYGARSFSILNAEGVIVFDSGSHIDEFAAANGLLDDGRSDARGMEPEGISIGVVDGKTLAFVTLERGEGGVMVYDVTNPLHVSFVQYLGNSGDESPEGVLFVSEDESLTGHELLVVSNEVSGTVTIYQENDAPEVGREIGDVTVAEGGILDYRILADAFTDADERDTLTWTVTLADGSALPEWLSASFSYHDAETMLDYLLPNGDASKAMASGPATDSASAGTAMATGVKTVDGNIAWERTDSPGGEIETIAETLREELGFSIGVASTVAFSHATPATFVSHDVNRNNYWDISDEILFDTEPEVVIGAGYNSSYFAKATLNSAKQDTDIDNNGYNDEYDAFVNDTDGTDYVFAERATGVDGGDTLAAAGMEVDLSAGEKLFGLFGTAGGNFEYYEVSDTPGEATITRSTGDSTPTVDEDPTLAEVTQVSLSVLNQDEDGFFIMIEQGDIDWSNHADDYENMVGGVYDLEMAVTEAEHYIESGGYGINWSNTLVIVTSDHSNSYLRAQEVMGKGDLPTQSGKRYPDGEVSYGSGGHTNELVTVSARGAGATYFGELAGQIYEGTEIVDNTQIYDAMINAATKAGAEHIILFIGDGMNVEHEIAGSRYLYGADFSLTWHDWGTLEDGWSGYATTWDVTAYNQYAGSAGEASYTEASYDPLTGYDPAKGGETPYPVAMTFSGTPGREEVGTIEITVTATDENGASVSQNFDLTVDKVPETVSMNPEDGVAAVAVMQDIVITFDEEIVAGDGTVALWKDAVGGTLAEAFRVNDSSAVTIAGSQLRIDPTEMLDYDSHYVVSIGAGSVDDLSGGSSAADSISFDTREAHEESTQHDFGGSITFWKTGEAIDEVMTTLASTSGSMVEFRNLQLDAEGNQRVEIWKTETDGNIDGFELHLALEDGATASWSDAEELPADWVSYVNEHEESTGLFNVGIMEVDANSTGLSSEPVRLGTLTVQDDSGDGDFELALVDGAVHIAGEDDDRELATFALTSTTADGVFEVRDLSEGNFDLNFTKSDDSVRDAVQISDALATLKLALGMNPNRDGSSVLPYQYLAADVNQDGKVRLGDALSILKMAVGLDSAPSKGWLFVPDSVAEETMGRTSVHWGDYFSDLTIAKDTELDLIGVVRGDVNGSWTAAEAV